MRNRNKQLILLILCFSGYLLKAQSIHISGEIIDKKTKEPIGNVVVKSANAAVIADLDGEFNIDVESLPVVLNFSTFGYTARDIAIIQSTKPITVKLKADQVVLAEAQIVASRITEKQKQAPLTVEALDLISIKEAPALNFYEALGNMKGVDLTSASIGFKIINTRGFNSTSPVRSLQIIDGVDNQAPGLNFSLGNFLGASELDIQKVDIISGAVGAIYGPSAFNGVISMVTKDPYTTQGTSFQLKVGERALTEVSLRYATALSRGDGTDSWALKLNVFGLRANDWEANNMDATFESTSSRDNPGGYDAVNRYGDEIVYDHGGDVKTYAGIGTYHRQGIEESELVDYQTENLKVAAALHYKTRTGLEAIYSMNFGSGTTVYQGDNRLSLKDILFLQNRFELRKKDAWFIRAYRTNEDAGKTYDAYFTALKMQDSILDGGFWANQYRSFWTIFQKSKVKSLPGYPADNLSNEDFEQQMSLLRALYPDEFSAYHQENRAMMSGAYDPDSSLIPGSQAFNDLKQYIISTPFHSGGSRFYDRSALSHVQFQREFDFSEYGNISIGGNYRSYNPNSRGTIFSDTNGIKLQVSELGFFSGYSKETEKVSMNVTLRLDKNQNFSWLASPAMSMVYRPNNKTVLRIGASSAIRNPTLQDQYLYYNVGRAILVGNLTGYDSLITISEVGDFLEAGVQERAAWDWNYYNMKGVRPEKVKNIEVGYRSTWWKSFYVDATYYYSWYKDFIGYHVALKIDDDPGGSAANRLKDVQAYRISSNAEQQVTTQGFSVGTNYYFSNYTIAGNYTWNVLNSAIDDPIIPAYNTPEHKYNLSFSARDLDWKIKNGKTGYMITHKFVQGFLFEGSPQFTGIIPSYRLTDAQLSWTSKEKKWIIKIGSSNLFNQKVVQVYGGPSIGRLTYLALTCSLE